MKAKIFSFIKLHQNTIIPSAHIARFVGRVLDIPLCWDASIGDEPLDVLVIVNGAYAFAGGDILAGLGKAIMEAGRVVWVQNDYTVIPPKPISNAESPFRKAFRMRHESGAPAVDYWTTVQSMTKPGKTKDGFIVGDNSFYINWNALSVAPRDPVPLGDRPHGEYMVYYGSLREHRAHLFDKYFKAPTVKTVISCPSDKFVAAYKHENLIHVDRFEDLMGELWKYGFGLYLEDKKSSLEMHSPANRFYEMLNIGLPMVFPPDSMRMMEKAGYDINEYVLWRADEAAPLWDKWTEMMEGQRAAWLSTAVAERETLETKLRQGWSRY